MTVTVSASTTGSAKLRALQQRPQVPHVGEGGDAGARPALHLLLGRQQGGAQLAQRAAAEQGGQQQPVGLQGAADLDERARQIVDEVQRQARDDQVERLVAERQRFLVGPHARGLALREQARPRARPRSPSRRPAPAAAGARRGRDSAPRLRATGKRRCTAARRSTRSSATRASRNSWSRAPAATRSRRRTSSARSKMSWSAVMVRTLRRYTRRFNAPCHPPPARSGERPGYESARVGPAEAGYRGQAPV